jgi:multisubunit Na+/H+ antiporter MnhF subunit
VVALLLVALSLPVGAATAGQVALGQSSSSLLTQRIGPASLFEIAALPLIGFLLLRMLAGAPRTSRLDGVVLLVLAVLGLCTGIAVLQDPAAARNVPFDVERVLVPLLGYLLISRTRLSHRAIRVVIGVIAGVLALSAVRLVVQYGLISGTEFATASGRQALLITEDSLLVVVPIVVFLARALQRPFRPLLLAAALGFAAAAIAVDLISLRRGGLLAIAAVLVMRILASFNWRGRAAAVLMGAVLVLAVAVPAVVAIERWGGGSLGQSGDASQQQRAIELTSLEDNLDGLAWVTGRGIGAFWHPSDVGPVEIGTFGSKETATQRIGWHLFGADWVFKIGLGGCLALVAIWAVRLLRRPSLAPSVLEVDLRSLSACLPVLALFAWTNLRVGLVAGIILGLLSMARTPQPESSAVAVGGLDDEQPRNAG